MSSCMSMSSTMFLWESMTVLSVRKPTEVAQLRWVPIPQLEQELLTHPEQFSVWFLTAAPKVLALRREQGRNGEQTGKETGLKPIFRWLQRLLHQTLLPQSGWIMWSIFMPRPTSTGAQNRGPNTPWIYVPTFSRCSKGGVSHHRILLLFYLFVYFESLSQPRALMLSRIFSRRSFWVWRRAFSASTT